MDDLAYFRLRIPLDLKAKIENYLEKKTVINLINKWYFHLFHMPYNDL